ncbi:DUF2490 domain-containing protein [Sphingomonas adhaesiva]|uniref:DUF2490 domain-containing protein n=1 Tax=Sphingomonas adhaesiva TaxID=28212 RepID=UPI002FF6537B
MSSIRHITVIATLLAATPAAAETEHDLGGWLNVTVQGHWGKNGAGAWFAEVQPRLQDDLGRVDQVILRGAVGYKVARGLTLYQGYAHVVMPVSGGTDIGEDRTFQQVSWVIPGLARGELSSRTRFEQRWRSDGHDMQLRAREMVRFEYPLGRDDGVRALTSVEGFWAFNSVDWRPRSGFDQVRTFVGAEIPIGGTSTVEAGYLNQIIDRPGNNARMNHNISLSVFWRL